MQYSRNMFCLYFYIYIWQQMKLICWLHHVFSVGFAGSSPSFLMCLLLLCDINPFFKFSRGYMGFSFWNEDYETILCIFRQNQRFMQQKWPIFEFDFQSLTDYHVIATSHFPGGTIKLVLKEQNQFTTVTTTLPAAGLQVGTRGSGVAG